MEVEVFEGIMKRIVGGVVYGNPEGAIGEGPLSVAVETPGLEG